MADGVRAFVAIDLPQNSRGELAALQRSLSPRLSGFRWGKPETLHLTLRFLGNVSPERFDAVGAFLERGLAAGGPLTLNPQGLGVFPDLRRPRVLWVGLGGDTTRLARLAVNLSASLDLLGLPPERKPFRAHLTLARAVGAARPGAVARVLDEYLHWEGSPFTAGELVLFESILESGGARHIPRRRGILL